MKKIFVFGYGSLINRRSAERAIKRTLSPRDVTPCFINGFSRRWLAKEVVWFESINSVKNAVFLDIVPQSGAVANGVIIKISERELSRLKAREKNYDCIDVTGGIVPKIDGDVYAFSCNPRNRAQKGETDIFIPDEYIKMVEAGCLEIDSSFLRDFRETTEPPQFEIVRGKYVFVDPEQSEYT